MVLSLPAFDALGPVFVYVVAGALLLGVVGLLGLFLTRSR